MNKYIDVRNFNVVDELSSLHEGIRKATELLHENGYTNDNYTNAVIQNFNRYGRNFIVSPYVILPHARPEQGVIHSGFSMLLVKRPLFYKESSVAVRLVIVLAAKDSLTHLEFLKFFAHILSSEEKLQNIMNADNEREMLDAFQG